VNNIIFAKAMLCILEANQLSSKVADEILKYKEGQSHSFGGLGSGFHRIGFRLEAIAEDTPPERFNWSQEEKAALQKLVTLAGKSDDAEIVVAASKVQHLFFLEG
jgi:hypothetical protein